MKPETYIANTNDWLVFSKNMNVTVYSELLAITQPTEKPFVRDDIFNLEIDEKNLIRVEIQHPGIQHMITAHQERILQEGWLQDNVI